MGDGQRPQRAAVKGAVERDDEAAVAVWRGHHAVHQRRLDRVLHRLGAGVDDEMARRAGRRDPAERGLEAERQDRLILGVRVSRHGVGQRFEHGAHRRWIVFSERVGRDQRAHVEKAIRLAGRVTIDDRQVRSDGLGRIERDRQRIEQAARGRIERALRQRQVLGDQAVERTRTVAQPLWYTGAHLAGAVPRIEPLDALEELQRRATGRSRSLPSHLYCVILSRRDSRRQPIGERGPAVETTTSCTDVRDPPARRTSADSRQRCSRCRTRDRRGPRPLKHSRRQRTGETTHDGRRDSGIVAMGLAPEATRQVMRPARLDDASSPLSLGPTIVSSPAQPPRAGIRRG